MGADGGRNSVAAVAVGGHLLDVHRRRELVERKVTRVDDADAVEGQ